MVCTDCGRPLTGFEHELCMDCSNREEVESEDYTKNIIRNMQNMGYTKEEILKELAENKYLNRDEVLTILNGGNDHVNNSQN